MLSVSPEADITCSNSNLQVSTAELKKDTYGKMIKSEINYGKILVVEDGKIIEHGTHDSLSVTNGLYARLRNLQFFGGA